MADAPFSPADEYAMRLALDQAQNAWLVGEVPVGAVIMRAGQVIATGYNRPITTHDPTAHAEIVALRHAATLLEKHRLPECELFVTLEPCAMCAMALMHARFRRVVFAARDPKTGVAGSVVDLFGLPNSTTTPTCGAVCSKRAALPCCASSSPNAARQRAPAAWPKPLQSRATPPIPSRPVK